jgi:hypothetical protein
MRDVLCALLLLLGAVHAQIPLNRIPEAIEELIPVMPAKVHDLVLCVYESDVWLCLRL